MIFIIMANQKINRIYCQKLIVIILLVTGINSLRANSTIYVNVLIAGGTASGTAAAIQAARGGASVVLVESSPWLGGMLTSAGVSATDGNNLLPSGIWGEFRNHIYDYYGGPDAVATGWVSNTQFEPHVGNMIFNRMVSQENRIITINGYHIIRCLINEGKVTGAEFLNEEATDTLVVNAQVTVDATETGDLMAMAGCRYHIGQDSGMVTGEAGAPADSTDIIQDITYVAVLRDYGDKTDRTIPKPDNYDSSLYECTCNCGCNTVSENLYDCDYMLKYGRLPNSKYMINWPESGNDYYLNDLEMDYYTRKKAWLKAKDHTLGWIYFVQTRAGYKSLGLADDEFPTKDRLAIYPYYRESRRLEGVIQLRNADVSDPYKNNQRPFYKYAVSVGDYPLDLHHKKMPVKIIYGIEKVPSFSVPYGCLIPKTMDGLIVAEKSISVTHIVNGCTRLQPSVMLIGQAAGCAAALCIRHGIEPRLINVRELQQSLLNAGCWLVPYIDVTPADPSFQQVQRVALCGLMRGSLISEGWANKSYFYPDQLVTKAELENIVIILNNQDQPPVDPTPTAGKMNNISGKYALRILYKIYRAKVEKISFSDFIHLLNSSLQPSMKISDKNTSEPITRKEIACWLDALFNPFEKPLFQN
jgi:hypothetical protein